MNIFRFENKKLRSLAVKLYMEEHGFDKAVCFSCGNASRELKNSGVQVLDISPSGDLEARRWFTAGEIRKTFPDYFDATSGHLPFDCLELVALLYRQQLGDLQGEINLPTGSGETLVCLKMVYPELKINAVYNLDDATRYDEENPLNHLVEALAERIILADAKN